MKKTKGTKRALFTSFLALLLSMSMLAGTTFAWFTDEVISGNNTIMAGNLDVELKYASAPGGTYTSVEGMGDLFVAPAGTTKGLWEPGHTEVAYLQVHNAGTLHLQYNLAVSPFTETVGKDAEGKDIQLSKILKFAATEPAETAPEAFTRETAQAAAAASGVALTEYQQINVPLAPGKTHYIALVVYMPEEVENEANYRGADVPTIEFAVTLLATQEIEENDSFGKDYDDKATYPNATHWVDAVNGAAATTDAAGTFLYENEAKTFRAAGETTGDVTVTVVPAANDELTVKLPGIATVSYDIKVEGHTPGSKVVIDLFVGEDLEQDPVVYLKDSEIASAYNKDTGFVTFETDDFSPFTVAYGSLADTWDGTADTTWYNENNTQFELKNAEQLAGLAELVDGGNTFEGKTIKLTQDLDLAKIPFNPIGHSANGQSFNGTFDGQGHTISNMYEQSDLGAWQYEGEYYGLFAYTNGATIKNVTIADAYISSGRNEAAGVVGNAVDTTFSDITISNTTLIAYNNSAGGVAAECYGNCSFTNITVDEKTVIGPLWGTYDVRLGGVVGLVHAGNNVKLSNVTVACQLDAINDVAANYQYWLYRYCGMLIGHVDGVNGVADPTGYVTCENVKVVYSDWVNYHYCEDADLGAGSYNGPGEYKYARVEAGTGTDGIDLTACNHNDDESHNVLIVFDQLFGGGQGISGLKTYDGVTVIYNDK